MDSRLQHLKNSIHIKNEFNRIARAIVEQVKEASKPFIGKKINTLKGLTEKYRAAVKIDHDSIDVKPLPGTKWAKLHRAYVSVSYKNLTIELSLCFSDGATGCTYEQQTFYFGNMEDSILTSINEDCKVTDTVFDFDAEVAKIKKFRELEAEAERAKSEINVPIEAYKYLTIGYGL